MPNASQKTYEFLRKIDMHPEQTSIEKTAEDIVSEMRLGLLGESSSIAMVPTYISADAMPEDGEPIIVADAGGTNLRVGLCEFVKGKPVFSDVIKSSVPGSSAEIDIDDFFDEIAEKILPYSEKSSNIGFCFSYPAEVFPNHDGKIINLNKELRVKNAEGSLVGRSIIQKLKKKGADKAFSFSLLNDTTAALLGGIANLGLKNCGGIGGLILGTGVNTSIVEKGINISKLKNADDMIINCESGNFSAAFRGKADFMTDLSSKKPGDHLFEKMLSGAYLGILITNTAKLAFEYGLLSNSFEAPVPFTAPELDDFLRGNNNRISKICTNDDSAVLRCIIDAVYERAAKLVCANIAAICIHTDGGKDSERPYCIIAEGTTFYNSLLFYAKLNKLKDEFIIGELHRYLVFRHAENLTLSGAALSVFTDPSRYDKI